jgi:hypothetical protein
MSDRSPEPRSAEIRGRLARILAALSAEDLEERVAPVKCAKHPNNSYCDTTEYGVVDYGVPEDSRGEGGE